MRMKVSIITNIESGHSRGTVTLSIAFMDTSSNLTIGDKGRFSHHSPKKSTVIRITEIYKTKHDLNLNSLAESSPKFKGVKKTNREPSLGQASVGCIYVEFVLLNLCTKEFCNRPVVQLINARAGVALVNF